MEKYLIKDGKTEYSILTTQIDNEILEFVRDEIKLFFSECANAEISDTTEYEKFKKYISVGNTELYKLNQEKFDLSDLNSQGFVIKTIDDNYIIYGKTDRACLYGVYELLNKLLDVEFYSYDEVKAPKVDEVKFVELDIMSNPDIEYRQINYWSVFHDHKTSERYRSMYAPTDRDVYFGFWGTLFGHTFIKKLLPIEKDAEGKLVHPDWYAESLTQVCLTNEEARKVFTERLKETILKYPTAKFFCVGIDDNDQFCKCPKCLESYEKYGFNGTHLRYVNQIAKDIKVWAEKTIPDREYYLPIFAYVETKTPPTKYDEELKKYVPLDPSFVLEDNVTVFNAPIDLCGYHKYGEKCNRGMIDRFEGWKALCKNMMIWDYHSYFDNAFIYMPDTLNLKSQFEYYKKYNPQFIYTQNVRVKTTGFQDLKAYLEAKLAWDCTLDDKTLIDDYFVNYYKDVATEMREYFDMLHAHYKYLEGVYDKLGKRGYHVSYDTPGHPEVMTEMHWPKEFLDKADALLLRALDKANKIEDVEIREKLVKRVETERCMIVYWRMEVHTYFCSKEEFDAQLKEFVDITKRSDITEFTMYGKTVEQHVHRFLCRYPARDING